MRIGFIGAGNMAGAIIRGMVAAGYKGANIYVYDVMADKLMALFDECGIVICRSAEDLIEQAQTVVLGVKPQQFAGLLSAVAEPLRRERPLIISIAAGVTIASIETQVGAGLPIVRTMQNINAKIGESISAICGNSFASDADINTARGMFEAIGEVVELEERLFSAFSVMAACSPAYALLYMDALAQAGVRFGIPRGLAQRIAAQAVLGSARMLQESGEHPRTLIDWICSPGGTTVEGITALQKSGFEAAVAQAFEASYQKDLSFS